MKRLLICLALIGTSLRAEPPCLLEGPEGTGVRVAKYLLDSGVDYTAAYRSGDVVVRRRADGMECISKWQAPVPLPTFGDLPSLAESRQLLDSPSHDRVFEAGKWRVKTQAEQDATPGGKRRIQREAARTNLVAELRSAGFTNATFNADAASDWVDTASLPAPQEKKITRLLDRFVSLSVPPVPVVE